MSSARSNGFSDFIPIREVNAIGSPFSRPRHRVYDDAPSDQFPVVAADDPPIAPECEADLLTIFHYVHGQRRRAGTDLEYGLATGALGAVVTLYRHLMKREPGPVAGEGGGT